QDIAASPARGLGIVFPRYTPGASVHFEIAVDVDYVVDEKLEAFEADADRALGSRGIHVEITRQGETLQAVAAVPAQRDNMEAVLRALCEDDDGISCLAARSADGILVTLSGRTIAAIR